MKKRLASLGLALAILLTSSGVALADQPTTPGITIYPSQVDLVLRDGQQLTQEITIRNSTPSAQELTATAIDFGGLSDSGGLIFLGKNEINSKYGLANWIKLGATSIQLAPGETTTLKATIVDRADLSPGAHYGAIVVTKGSVPVSSDAQVPLRQSLVSLVFLNKDGATKESVELSNVRRTSASWMSPRFDLEFKNTGNTFIVPRGVAQILDPSGRELFRGAVNESSLRMLPGSSRHFPLELIRTGTSILPGRYSLRIQYRFDGQDEFANYSQMFWYWPPLFWVAILLLICFMVGVVLGLRMAYTAWRRRRLRKKRR